MLFAVICEYIYNLNIFSFLINIKDTTNTASMKKNKEKLISMKEFEKEFNIDFDKIDPINEEEIK